MALVAEQGASSGGEGSPWVRPAGAFFGELGDFLRQERPHERHLDSEAEDRFVPLLLCPRPVRRSSPFSWRLERDAAPWPQPEDDNRGIAQSLHTGSDLAAMANAFIGSQPQLVKGNAVLNPSFAYLGGADGDLIVDGCYIDIEATLDPKKPSPPQWPWELLGYALLDHDHRYAIRSVGLFLPRRSLLMTWPLEDSGRMLAGNSPAPLSVDAARRELQSWLAAA